MSIREWVANNIGYKYLGCFYTKHHDHIFDFIEAKIPKEFFDREISDLGCGDGSNTFRLEKIFRAKSIIGYEHNSHLIERGKKKGLKIRKFDFNKETPKGEMATFTFSLHHAKDKEETLKKTVANFNYVFLCEPILDLYHRLLDAGGPLKKEDWIKIFDKVLKKYILYQYKNNLVVFYKNYNRKI